MLKLRPLKTYFLKVCLKLADFLENKFQCLVMLNNSQATLSSVMLMKISKNTILFG